MKSISLRRFVYLLMIPVLVVSGCGILDPDPSGNVVTFKRELGNSDPSNAHSVRQTSDGGYIIGGNIYSEGLNWGVYLVKTGASGNEEWSYRYGGELPGVANSVQQTMDGGFVVTGSIQNDSLDVTNILLLKVDASGTEEWSFTFWEGFRARGFSVQQTTDGGYILTGHIWVDGLGYAFLIKTDGNGAEEWNRLYGALFDGEPLLAQLSKTGRSTQIGQTPSTGEEFFSKGQAKSELFGSACSAGCLGNEAGLSVKQTKDGGYIIAGETQSFSVGSVDVWLVKTNSEGSTEWNSVFGGRSIDEANSVEQTADGGFIICGSTRSYGLAHSNDVWIIKTDAQGTESWSKTYGGKGFDEGHSIQQTNDGGFIIVGGTEGEPDDYDPDVLLIKIDALGNEKWLRTFGNDGFETGNAVRQTWDGGYILAGTYSTGFSNHIWLLKTDSDGKIEPD